MNVHIMSRKEIEGFKFTEPSVAICIAYPTGRFHKVTPSDKLLAVHHTRFSDCDSKGVRCFPKQDVEQEETMPMRRGQAVDIVDFVEMWRWKVKELYIACYGGISRSTGVGAGLCNVYGWDAKECYTGIRVPNMHCKHLVSIEGFWGVRR